MKLIHCADLHLDSRLNTHLGREQAKRRRDELLRNFARLAAYAEGNGVEAVLIAGDLFDRDTVSALAKNTVLSVIAAHPQIRFYYLRGNHDSGDYTDSTRPQNLFLFGNRWRSFREGADGRISVTGIELTRENTSYALSTLHLDPGRFNIVMLHGQETGGSAPPDISAFRRGDSAGHAVAVGSDRSVSHAVSAGNNRSVSHAVSSGSDRSVSHAVSAGSNSQAYYNSSAKHNDSAGSVGYTASISIRALQGKGIDYLALGHVHTYKYAKLDSRGIYCYPGCLEGRGFDESGPHGFVLLDIDEKRLGFSSLFVPFARRTLFTVDVDVTGCRSTAQINDLIRDALHSEACTEKDMVDVTIRGELDVDCEADPDYLRTDLEARHFFARLHDETIFKIDAEDYLYDESLRGEFVRLVMADDSIPEEEKTEVIRCGFQAMDGEELVRM